MVESTNIKVKEGEWDTRKLGGSKRRVWRKIHIRGEEETLGIRAAEFTTSDGGGARAAEADRPLARSGDRQRHGRRCHRHPQVPRRHS